MQESILLVKRILTSRDQKGRNFQNRGIWIPHFFSGDCSGVKGRKWQGGVGLAIKNEIVKIAGKGSSIGIEFISARLLKARILIKSNFFTFVVAYALTEEGSAGGADDQIHGNP